MQYTSYRKTGLWRVITSNTLFLFHIKCTQVSSTLKSALKNCTQVVNTLLDSPLELKSLCIFSDSCIAQVQKFHWNVFNRSGWMLKCFFSQKLQKLLICPHLKTYININISLWTIRLLSANIYPLVSWMKNIKYILLFYLYIYVLNMFL